MSTTEFSADWHAFTAGVLSTPAGVPAQTGGTRWHMALPSMAKPVLVRDGVPAAEPLEGFLRKDWQRRVARLWTRLPAALRQPLAPIWTCSVDTQRALSQLLPAAQDAVPTALYFGSRGPLQKVTVLLQTGDDATFVSKVALRPTADGAILNEVRWLRQLADHRSLAPSIPTLVAQGRLDSGRAFLSTRAWPMTGTQPHFTPRHAEFLAELCTATVRQESWMGGASEHRLLSMMSQPQLAPRQGPVHAALHASLKRLREDPSARVAFPNCVVHGDFAPWNVSVDRHGALPLRIFDWEYAHDSGSPLDDVFHFLLVQAVLQARHGAPGLGFVDRVLMPAARRQLALSLPDWPLDEAWMAWALRLYLTATLAFYLSNSTEPRREHRVISAFAQLLQQLEGVN